MNREPPRPPSMTFTILIDTREQRPLVFPARMVVQDPRCRHEARPLTLKIETKKVTLPTADYTVLQPGYAYADQGTVLIETKRSVTEIAANVFGPKRPSFVAELQRLHSQWRHPIILCEGDLTLDTIVSAPRPTPLPYPPECAIDEFLRLCYAHRCTVHIIPPNRGTRAYAGAFAARILWAASHEEEPWHSTPSTPSPRADHSKLPPT